MLGVGVRVGGLGAAPAPVAAVVVAPPPLNPLPPLSPSFSYPAQTLRRRIRRAAAAAAAKQGSRRWWSDDDGYDYQEEDEDADAFPSPGFGSELFDEPWFSKVFKRWGYLLPVMLASMLIATGPRAFLMAMAIPLGQSAILFLLDAIWGRRGSNRNGRRWQPPFEEEEEEEEDYPDYSTDFATGARGNRENSSYYGRRRQQSYQSWVSEDDDFASAGASADDHSTKGSSKSSGSGGFGGWDELLHDDGKQSPGAGGCTTYYSKGSPPPPPPSQSTSGEDDAASRGVGREVGVGATRPPAPASRTRTARGGRRMSWSSKYNQVPLFMRLLVAVFPFLGSWFSLL